VKRAEFALPSYSVFPDLRALAWIAAIAAPLAAAAQTVPPPDAPAEDLPRRLRVARHGITWTFDREAPVENMPVYGREFARAVGMASLLLCLDLPPEEKEPLLIGLAQVGIDLWGLAQDGQPATWRPLGVHGIGRKWPIVFAGWLLDDPRMQSPTKTLPDLVFSEDRQTMFDVAWTGARAVYAGHAGRDGHPRHAGWGRYEHLPPEQWEFNAESWRRCRTSSAWVAQALAARLLRLEAQWNHEAFFAYVDRWIFEDDTAFVARIRQAKGWDFSADWARQGAACDPCTKAMWQRYRTAPGMPPADTWKERSGP